MRAFLLLRAVLMSLVISGAAATAACNAEVDLIDAAPGNGTLEIRAGSTVLVSKGLTATAFEPAGTIRVGYARAFGDDGVTPVSAANPLDFTASGTGTADNFRVLDGSAAVIWSGTVSLIGGGGDLELVNTAIVSGQVGSITSWDHEVPTHEGDPDVLVLVIGASNATFRNAKAGWTALGLDVAQPTILHAYWLQKGVDPPIESTWAPLAPITNLCGFQQTLARDIADAVEPFGRRVGIITYADGGSGTDDWIPSEDDTITDALVFFQEQIALYPRTARVLTVFMNFGSSESLAEASADAADATYAECANVLRDGLGFTDVIFNKAHVSTDAPFNANTRARQDVLDTQPGFHMFSLDDYTDPPEDALTGDLLHFTDATLIQYGYDGAAIAVSLL